MRNPLSAWASCLCLSLSLAALTAQGQGTLDDYRRADELGRGVGRPRPPQLHWVDGGDACWYELKSRQKGKKAFWLNCLTGESTPLIDFERLGGEMKRRHPDIPSQELEILQLHVDSDRSVSGLYRMRNEVEVFVLRANQEIEFLRLDQDHAFRLPPDRGPTSRRSGRGRRQSRQRVDIFFVNRSSQSLKVVWLNGSERREYETLDPNDTFSQRTTTGHRWEIVGPNEQAWARYTAGQSAGVCVIRAPTLDHGETEDDRAPIGDLEDSADPSDAWRLTVRKNNVHLLNESADVDIPLTEDGSESYAYSDRFQWTADRRFALTQVVEAGNGRVVKMVESSPKDRLQPRVQSYSYDKPGDKIDRRWPVLFDLQRRKQIEISRSQFPNPFSIRDLRWDETNPTLTFLYNERGHQTLRLIEVQARTGEVRALVSETSPTFIDYSNKTFYRLMESTGEFLWMSERDGWNHLYLYDRVTGKVKNQVTKGKWVVRGIDHVDEDQRVIWFRACGVIPDQDPYHIHYARVDFDGNGLQVLTSGDGTHAVSYSPHRRFLVDTYSRVDLAPVTEVRDGLNGKLVKRLERAEIPEDPKGPPLPERFVAKGRDGVTDIFGLIFRPSHFDPTKKYPVIENIYAGPHGQHVPKSFAIVHGGQRLAEIGFIVVRIDGMGTNWRSRAFHDVAWKNLKDAGFPDRIAWMKAAADAYPQLDLSRVGIYGGSAGGQSAMRALLDFPEFYKAAAADCGCHDNRMDKIWWNEQWMGWPVDESYAASSNVVDAHKLQGALLLTVGELDRNVDPASTMQVVDALIRADKDFELIVFPGGGHGSGGSAYGTRRLRDFFVRELWNLEPRRDS